MIRKSGISSLPVYLSAIILLLVACSKKDDENNMLSKILPGPKTIKDVSEFEQATKGEKSPHKLTITQRGVKFDLLYLPTDAILVNTLKFYQEEFKNLKSDSTQTEETINKRKQEMNDKLAEERKLYDQSLYFSLTIGYEDKSKDLIYASMNQGFDNYQIWFDKLTFGMKEYIYLYHEKIGKIPLGLYQMDNTYGMTKERSFLLVFPKEFQEQGILLSKGKLELVVGEFGLKTGQVRFPVNKILKTKYKLQYPEVM